MNHIIAAFCLGWVLGASGLWWHFKRSGLILGSDDWRLKMAHRKIRELGQEGYDFTWTRNADLIDDGKSWIRFHRMGHYGTVEGDEDIASMILLAAQRLKDTPPPQL